jgi:hypothetical protein
MSPFPRVRRLFQQFFHFSYSITHLVKRLGDRFQIRYRILKTHCQGVGRYIGLHL